MTFIDMMLIIIFKKYSGILDKKIEAIIEGKFNNQ